MRTIILVASQAYLAEQKHAIHLPLSLNIRRWVEEKTQGLPEELKEEERQMRIAALEQKKRSYRFLSSDLPEDILSRCRNQSHFWSSPYFVICFGPKAKENARYVFQQLEYGTVSDIVTIAPAYHGAVSAQRLECGILETFGTMENAVVKDAVLNALLDFVVSDDLQQRIFLSSTGSVRPPTVDFSATA